MYFIKNDSKHPVILGVGKIANCGVTCFDNLTKEDVANAESFSELEVFKDTELKDKDIMRLTSFCYNNAVLDKLKVFAKGDKCDVAFEKARKENDAFAENLKKQIEEAKKGK